MDGDEKKKCEMIFETLRELEKFRYYFIDDDKKKAWNSLKQINYLFKQLYYKRNF